MHTRSKVVPLALGTALVWGSLAAPPAEATAGAAGQPTSVTASPRRQPVVERQAMARLNAVRKQRKVRPVKANACLNGVMVSLAQRNAKSRRLVGWTKQDTQRIRRCAGRGGSISYNAVWGASRSATSWVNGAIGAKKLKVNKSDVMGGVGAYRDTRGVLWIAMVTAHPGK